MSVSEEKSMSLMVGLMGETEEMGEMLFFPLIKA